MPVHQLPSRARRSLQQAVLNKTWRELQGADPTLVKGLVPGAGTILARDLGSQDRETLRRNLGGTKVGTLYGDESKLDLFDAAVSRGLSELAARSVDLPPAVAAGICGPDGGRGTCSRTRPEPPIHPSSSTDRT